MKVLVIGGGAREHALCRSLSLDPDVTAVHCAPGNAGIGEVAELHPVDALDGAAVARLAADLEAGLVVVGPEAPLVAGVADAVRAAGIPCFGPSGEAAQLEGSKAFAKDVMAAAGVPTARSYVCTNAEEIDEALDAFGAPYVVKDDGLAAGKGVVVTGDLATARAHALACDRVVIEEYLDGPEVSLFAITDGETVVPLTPAQDFKRALDGDEGPNTGGMGAYSPLPWADPKLVDDVMSTVLQPTVDELRRRGTPFAGLLYAGLAITSRGVRVIEFNARFGDPETQVVLARLRTPLAGVLLHAAKGTLADEPPLRWHEDAAVTVVVASHNYPDTPRTGDPITGLAEVAGQDAPHAYVLHAGTRQDGDTVVSAGGRVLSVTATGKDLREARERAYAAVGRIGLDGSHHRTDIARDAAESA
ncbi:MULTISPECIES: phosphoribosylamine--glycine ligase [Streptomyces]|uniref:Phosphoribosylamine--glycine ligase n=1 Tax=Streptomyces tsukubensis (strain DSM 42081 / NBRC 108919 / NRRL 18488 / 9993) TaxID=1114943 RepID=I2N1K4_STRT9|nr:phosphoribosylamine--glycine ligase [Streptomyces tsukubensis]MYS63194.1 phosphoribosylamine--glycine ligase [Streptomyces sp. SID5473]AZK95057.1 phosphoribosylamine--glycine ligase [Streptomyces tsukubensis]EIF90901.1 phosphoribosylamine--glycine ligase [Streptomyces tsukubensis NRRL18488]QKM68876.1 phosphoribosylamine--glycine ligase [Streptomyces tsukubensis NRRL18488]TAI43681.1 phosphoribosylamine--glycine ligase [Streptomyces tsukubensis]